MNQILFYLFFIFFDRWLGYRRAGKVTLNSVSTSIATQVNKRCAKNSPNHNVLKMFFFYKLFNVSLHLNLINRYRCDLNQFPTPILKPS